jgi:S1-C subfamily serine protease
MRINTTIRLFAIVLASGLATFQTSAQTPAPPEQAGVQEPRRPIASTRVNPVIVGSGPTTPQVVTILHRLNGLKLFRLLLRSGEHYNAIINIDDAFQIAGDVHTNVIAGLTLDDGQTIAAWLPEAEAEMPPPPIPAASRTPGPPRAASNTTQAPNVANFPGSDPKSMAGFESLKLTGSLLGTADLKVITRDGKRLLGRYIGLDGLTGLSVITLASSSFPKVVEAKEQPITVGQRLRLIGPEPASHGDTNPKAVMYVRIGQTEATVINVNRSPSGAVARVHIKATKLTPANIGGIALNESGETIGIVDAVEGGEATIVPVALIRSAVKRVIARQASVPRPWLGIRGEPLRSVSLDRLLGVGWEPERARFLTEKREGIMLTFVAPGSPAALGQLGPGDVILAVNKEAIRNADDFSWMLQEAGSGSAVQFDVARLGKLASEALEIKLSESPDPFFGWRSPAVQTPRAVMPASLMAQGIETIRIRQKVAMRYGANDGLLVVYVQPATPAFKAGLLPGDVIEAIDGQKLFSGSRTMTLQSKSGASSLFQIVRNRQKMTLTVAAK